MTLSPGKLERMKRLAGPNGVIAALAMDQRGSLVKMLAKAKGCDSQDITPRMMAEFKTAVCRILSPHSSAILLDPEFGLAAAQARSPQTGLLLAYEKTGYDNERPGRLPDLLDNVSVKRIAEDFHADAVKVLMHYTPFEEARLDGIPVNDVKHALVERVGAECAAFQIPFFLEFVGYDPAGGDAKGFEFARIKPEVVTRSMAEFSRPHYQVDVLKVEIPINIRYVEGSGVYQGRKAYSRQEALEHFRRAAAAAAKPFIYLSAGVTNHEFVESLAMAAEAGADFSGVLCGRATWQEGVPQYVAGGLPALEQWLATEGIRNINAVNQALGPARAWYAKLGFAAPPQA